MDDNHQKLALFCSGRCPGKLILDAYDVCRVLGADGVSVVSGFHSPMELECLRILLRSGALAVWCVARGKVPRIPSEFRKPFADGRLTAVPVFPTDVRRQTIATGAKRNRIVADMADAVLIVHAVRGSKVEALSLDLLATGKPLYTFDHPANATIIKTGAQTITPETDWTSILKSFDPHA